MISCADLAQNEKSRHRKVRRAIERNCHSGTVFLGVVLVIAIGFFGARFIEIKVAGTEMLSRAFPSLLDLGVAMASGAAGAYSLSRESIRSSLAGEAISVSQVPPLAVVGIGLALGRKATADVGLSFRDVGLFSGGTGRYCAFSLRAR